jgi:3'(2'), 5'-bisphosphate nucleotidase
MEKEAFLLEQIQIEKIIAIAEEAGKATLGIYQQDFDVEMKDDRSPLTEADKRSNAIIIRQLTALYPDIPYISEETKQIPYSERKNWLYFWLIDPLDGTKEFVKKNGEFTINIALIHKDKPVLGVIYIPVKDLFYYAQRGKGSYKKERGAEAQRLQTESHKGKKKLVVVGSRSHGGEALKAYIQQLKETYPDIELISSGSSLKFCLVAEGKADIYPRTGPTNEWDTAAGHAVVLESGKAVYEFDSNQPLVYNKQDLLNGWFIVR